MEQKMFCYQCQETAGCKGCTMSGVCGKKPDVAAMQDLLVYVTKGISAITTALRQEGKQVSAKINHLITLNLFTTITNANFDKESIESRIRATLTEKEVLLKQVTNLTVLPEAAKWNGSENWEEKARTVGVLSTENEDIRSLRELITYGLKGLSAYSKHANVLLKDNDEVDAFLQKALAATLNDNLSVEDLIALTMETGRQLWKPRNYKGKYRCQKEPRHSGIRPRPARFGNAVRTDTGNWSGCVYAFRDVASSLLSRFQKISKLRRQLRKCMVETERGI